jgi:predicted site-specific integrase-resolvase
MSDTFSIGQAARRIGKTVKTLQRWDKQGVLVAMKTPTGRRVYTLDLLRSAMGLSDAPKQRKVAAYCRVSSQAQRPDLQNQRDVLEAFAATKGFANVEFVEEVGEGLNFKRPLFIRLVDQIVSGEVSHLLVAHKDRLARFGFDLLSHLCGTHGCEMLVISNEKLSPEVEMTQDLMTIVHCFSSRLYGLRNYKKTLKECLK